MGFDNITSFDCFILFFPQPTIYVFDESGANFYRKFFNFLYSFNESISVRPTYPTARCNLIPRVFRIVYACTMDDFMHNFIADFSTLDMENFRKFCFEKIHQYGIEEKIKLTHEYLKTMGFWSTLPQLRNKSVKSTTAAAELRRRGNLAFGAKNYSAALKWYTESIAFAPTGSQELAFAYANRSAVLISVGKQLECLLDINRAFKENYPEAGKQKLIDRKNKSVAFLRNAINLYVSTSTISIFKNWKNFFLFV